MRLIVPLRGVIHGRGGLFVGSLIPCCLFYFLQLYLKRRRPPPSDPAELPRTSSRTNLFSRGNSIGRVRVSSRAVPVAKPPDSPYYIGLERVKTDPYDRIKNTDGIIQLGLAESTLCFDLLQRWMSENLMDSMMQSDDGEFDISSIAMYKPFEGLLELRVAFADFMSRIMGDHGNAFLIPTPYYPGFDRDIKFRTGVELIPVHCRSSDNFTVTVSALEQALNQARKRGSKVSGILFSNPSNPVGNILSRETLQDILRFAQEKNIHVISDEIFAGSVYGDKEFVSMAEIAGSGEFDKSRVHIIYGLSKDLSIPGFRAGVIYSFHEDVVNAAKKLMRFSSVPVPVQRILISLLSDVRFIEEYMRAHRQRIRDKHIRFVEGLKQLGIPCAESGGGLYCWVDMSSLLTSYSEKGELELFEKLLTVAKINATPGTACYCIEPGWFRCCFTALADEDIPVIMERIRQLRESSRS
ncbi:probable aminotransferase ACS12 isoform X2 [Arabidopsis lyrata subsp. lyrata]|uniref:probable aminotransferase ACS12 isoform X2 n=1 Tax=Arabidopsis lyrata subsp. lyrata TaxID=81972 RepID=UPI000A29B251|nr:probable aminotransferase ACS12 isoform X2 [Arabidopsis lyrata subsp. lyrata]|eukprot:XP_020884717.1 probable aminotransferase ACS12 isoform X2 [Arabidopsis lyrata subsp. lyrata]